MKIELKNCLCGRKPKFMKRPVVYGAKVIFFYLACPNRCANAETFATSAKDVTAELWNSAIKRKLAIAGANK